ncbi:MAG: hypothetical protein KA761_05040 [Gemmatimonadaceae bacterium]|jgi:hypothetical protein|nr:hypothetical protein [Gemmatimonadaceae bacterium]
MRGDRRGIILPAVLASLVLLALLSSLALFDAVQEWRVAGLGDDQLVARAALFEGVDRVASPGDLPLLCVSAPSARQLATGAASGGGRFQVRWSHLGGGLVRAEVEGFGRSGARSGAIALVRPDSTDHLAGMVVCSRATRLDPAGPGWLVTRPGG